MAEGNLSGLKREETGKQAAKRMRLQGDIPGVLYGVGIDPTPLTINRKELLTMLHALGRNAVVNLSVGKSKKKYKTFIYDLQHDPLTGDITHVDLKQISMTEKIHVTVPVHITGTAFGVKNEGGIVEHMLHAIDVLCLPSDIPEIMTLDISDLRLGGAIHVGDIPSEKFEILTDEKSVVVHIIAPRAVKAEEGEGEEEILAAEGGAAEPEVIGQKREDGEEG